MKKAFCIKMQCTHKKNLAGYFLQLEMNLKAIEEVVLVALLTRSIEFLHSLLTTTFLVSLTNLLKGKSYTEICAV